MNVILLQSLSDLQRHRPLRFSHGHEDITKGAYKSRSPSRHKSNRYDMIIDAKLLDTPDRRGDRHKYYSNSGSDMHHDRHRFILTGEVIGDTFQMSLRRQIHLPLM